MKSPFIVDARRLNARLAEIRQRLTADHFKPELLDYTRKALATAARTTPARSSSLIRANQKHQYDLRVNCIPTNHHLVDPSLRVKGKQHWLFVGGKWYRADQWKLPSSIWSIYQDLISERNRRKQTIKMEFARDRAQARFLYARSWMEVGESIGLTVRISQAIRDSHTRRKPAVQPQRGRAQIRGGKDKLTVAIFNPFIESDSRYKDFNGAEIIKTAATQHEAEFLRRVHRAVYVEMKRIFKG